MRTRMAKTPPLLALSDARSYSPFLTCTGLFVAVGQRTKVLVRVKRPCDYSARRPTNSGRASEPANKKITGKTGAPQKKGTSGLAPPEGNALLHAPRPDRSGTPHHLGA